MTEVTGGRPVLRLSSSLVICARYVGVKFSRIRDPAPASWYRAPLFGDPASKLSWEIR